MLIIETISSSLSIEVVEILVVDRLNHFNDLLNSFNLAANFLQSKVGELHIVQIVTNPAAWEYLEAIGEINQF